MFLMMARRLPAGLGRAAMHIYIYIHVYIYIYIYIYIKSWRFWGREGVGAQGRVGNVSHRDF